MSLFKRPKKVKEPENIEHGYQYALFVLNLRLRTEGEMRDKMVQRGYTSETIDSVMQQLVFEKLVDDDRYAEIFIENMKLYKYYGFFQMKNKLILKKLPRELIESKLDELVTVDEEKQIAKKYLQKEFGDSAEIKKLPREERQKVMQRLQRRGFRTDVITSWV
jgi:regulatory protein